MKTRQRNGLAGWFGAAIVGLASLSPAAAEEAPRLEAPKKRIAVARFDLDHNVGFSFEGVDVGSSLAAQLATELASTGRFIVVERPLLVEVVQEQRLGAEQIASGETAPPSGRMLGAQLLVKAVVTEFSQTARKNGLRIGLGGFRRALDGLGVGISSSAAHVALDVRVIDTATGQVLRSHRAAAEAKSSGVSLELEKGRKRIGTEHFEGTPLGLAARGAIRQAVSVLLRDLEAIPWTGRVVDVVDGKLFLNAGSEAGLRVGDTFTVSSATRELVDPDSGLTLGILETVVGDVTVQSVEEKFAVAVMVTGSLPKRGDLVRPAAKVL